VSNSEGISKKDTEHRYEKRKQNSFKPEIIREQKKTISSST